MKYHKLTDKEKKHLTEMLSLDIEGRRALRLKCWCKWIKVFDEEDGYHFLCLKCADRVSRFVRRTKR